MTFSVPQRTALFIVGSLGLLAQSACGDSKDRRFAPNPANATSSPTLATATDTGLSPPKTNPSNDSSSDAGSSSATPGSSQTLPPSTDKDAGAATEPSASGAGNGTSTPPDETSTVSPSTPATTSTSESAPISSASSASASATAQASTSPSSTAPRGCGDDLLIDGGFEDNSSAWLQETTFSGLKLVVNQDNSTLTQRNVKAQSGTQLAWLGGTPDGTFTSHHTTLRQRVQLPVGINDATLSGYIWIATTEPDPNEGYDAFYLELVADDADETLISQFTFYRPLDATQGWLYFSFKRDELNRVSGQAALLRLNGYTDMDGPTDFFLDDLSLVVGCGH